MEPILKKVRNVDPNNSEAVKEALTSFFQCIPKYKELHSNRLLQEIQLILNRYPKYCLSHRNNLEQFLTSFLSSNNYFNVIEAAKCAHALQQVRPSQEKAATPRSSWRDQLNDLCNAAHTLIESIFTDAVEVFRNNKYEKPPKSVSTPMSVALGDISRKFKDFKNKQSILYLRLKNVLVFIQAMLVEIYPVAKPVQPQTVLDLIVRLLSLTSGTKRYDEDVCAIKTQTLRTLDALIVCLGSNMIPYSPLVFRLVLQTLKWTTNNQNDHTSAVRCTAYRSLGAWLTTLHTHRLSHSAHWWEDELTDTVVKDITPAKKVVQLTMGPQPTRHLSKKAKRKLASSQLQESNLAAYSPAELHKIPVSEEVNNEVALAALECAETFLTVCGRFFKPATHKLYQERLVRECYNYSSYTDDYLLRLLRVLEATRKTTPHGVPPTTQYCLHLYSLLVNSRRPEISKFCTQALLDIRLHLHCSPPSLNFSMEAPPETEQATNKRKKVSDRNRAMLESLLGANKIPPEIVDEDEDVISIPDEPSSAKKPRLESDETDQISLSSESERSVEEVCDESEDVVQVIQVIEEINEVTKQNDSTEPMIIEEQENEVLNPETTDQAIMDVNHEETDIQESIQQNKEEHINGNKDNATDEIEVDKEQEVVNIYEAPTQAPLNVSVDTIEEDRSSLEIVYDFPSTGKEKVAVLEKLDDENLPSTNDTDDIQITCGQVLRSSQDVDLEKKTIEAEPKIDETHKTPEVNGIVETVIENGVAEKTPDLSEKNKIVDSSKKDETSVEDMLADFVDEVNDDAVEA